jgi:DNA-binding SARP family transcriptional activator/Tfp pilus assembly protein PilF
MLARGRLAHGGTFMHTISGIRIYLLGRFAAFPEHAPDQPLSIPSRKARALLAYLAMQPEVRSPREKLATLLWGDRFDKQARQSLRQSLLSLRRQLEPIAPGLLVLDGELLGLNAQLFSTDARDFAALAEEGGDLERALGLYRGEFLTGFSLDVEPFDAWVQGERARLAAIAARLFQLQVEESDEAVHGDQALRACERLVAIDPLREDWQRLALKLTARHRGRYQAITQAKALVTLLRREFNAAPEPATAALIEDIKRGRIAPAAQARSLRPAVLVPSTDPHNTDVAAPVPLAHGAMDPVPMADAILKPEPAAGVLDWRWKNLQVWPLAALAGVVALAILASRLWLLAPGQSVSASTGHQSEKLLTPGRNDDAAIDVLIAKGWAAINRGFTPENLADAMASFKEAHKRDANLVPPMLGIASVSINLVANLLAADIAPHLELAEAFLQRALRKKPDDARVHHYLGRLHLERGNYAAALTSFARALDLNPDSPYTQAQVGITLVYSGRAHEGIAQIRRAIQLAPNGPHVGYWYIFAGVAELELGRTQAALDWLGRAFAVLPSNAATVHEVLAATYALGGEVTNAAKHAAELRRIVPEARLATLRSKSPGRLREGLALALTYPYKRP